MALAKILPAPGVVKGETDYSQQGRWIDANLVRFVGGKPEPIGGWAKLISTALTGVCRAIFGWRDGDANRRLVFGTHKKLQIYYDSALYDLTPLSSSGTLGADPITTTNASAIVSIEHTSHGRAVGDYVSFSGASAVGGITVSGEYTVTAVTDANNYTITHSAAASSGATGGGASVAYEYQLAIGSANDTESPGYGSGTYGSGPYGIGSGVGTPVPARTWTLDRYGEILVATPRGRGIYEWTPGSGTPSGRAAAMTGAPTACAGAFVTDERMVFAYGVETVASGSGFTGSKMLCQWSDETARTSWTPGATVTAGGRTLQGGNELLAHQRVAKGLYLIFSDTAAHLFQYSADRFVYSYRRVSDQAGIIGPKASCEIGGAAFWMGRDQFWMFDGVVQPMPSDDIRDYVFDSINFEQKTKCFAAVNTKFQEVWFFYPSAGASEVDRYVVWSIIDRVWVPGQLVRTAWFPRDIFDNPYATDADSYVYAHESGLNADGAALAAYITAAPGDIEGGNQLMDIDKIVPDFQSLAGTVELTMFARDKPNSAVTTYGPYSVTSATEEIDPDPRIDGRQIGLKIASSGTGCSWRLGMLRVNAQPAGARV